MRTLDEIGVKHGTDKASIWSNDEDKVSVKTPRYLPHDLLRHYEKVFEEWRNDEFVLAEVGVNTGASLRMWKEYFPHAQIVGIDINPNCKKHEEDRIDIFIADGESIDLYHTLDKKYGKCRIIIDDALHTWNNQRKILENLFPLVEVGGVYIVEDICESGSYVNHQHTLTDTHSEPILDYLFRLAATLNKANQRLYSKIKHLIHLPHPVRYIAQHLDSIQFVPHFSAILRKNHLEDRVVHCVTHDNGLHEQMVSESDEISKVIALLKLTSAYAIAVTNRTDNGKLELKGIVSERDLFDSWSKKIIMSDSAIYYANTTPTCLQSFEAPLCDIKYSYYPIVSTDGEFLGFRYELPVCIPQIM